MGKRSRTPKWMLLALLLTAALLALSACGKKAGSKVPSEAEYRRDLQDSGRFGLAQPYAITKLETIKSKTDTDDGQISAWVKVVSESDDDVCSQSYLLEYRQYDNGWMLEKLSPYEEDSWSVKPKKPLTEEELIRSWGSDRTIDWEFETYDCDLDKGRLTFAATYKEEHAYCTVYKRLSAEYIYSNYSFGADLGYASWTKNGMQREETLREEWKLGDEFLIGDRMAAIERIDYDAQGRIKYIDWNWDREHYSWLDSLPYNFTAKSTEELSCSQFYVNSYAENEDLNLNGYTARIENGYWGDFRYACGTEFDNILDHEYSFLIGYDRITFDCDIYRDAANKTLIVTLKEDVIPEA